MGSLSYGGAAGAGRVDIGSAASIDNLAKGVIVILARIPTATPASAAIIYQKGANTIRYRITTGGNLELLMVRGTANLQCSAALTNFTAWAVNTHVAIAVQFDVNGVNTDQKMFMWRPFEGLPAEPSAYVAQLVGSGTPADDAANAALIGNAPAFNVAFHANAHSHLSLFSGIHLTAGELAQFILDRFWPDKTQWVAGYDLGFSAVGTQDDISGNGNTGTGTSTVAQAGGPLPLGISWGADGLNRGKPPTQTVSAAAVAVSATVPSATISSSAGPQTIAAAAVAVSATVPSAALTPAPLAIAAGVPAVTVTALAATLARRTLPLIDMGSYTYWGLAGLLYPGSNATPAGHQAALMAAAALVAKLNTSGNPSPTGKKVLMAEGPSLLSQEWQNAQQAGSPAGSTNAWTLMGQAAADAEVDHTDLVILNGAYAGPGNTRWDSTSDPDYDSQVTDILTPAGITPAQVQVVMYKAVNGDPTVSLPTAGSDEDTQVTQLGNIIRAIKTRYVNCQIIYLVSRAYAGYANTGQNPEPYAYEGGFSVKAVVQAQIDQMDNAGVVVDTRAGDLNYSTGVAPVIAWGPYYWADGLTARSDGLTWLSTDFESDGTHPSTDGETKVADMLLAFLKSERSASTWFLAAQALAAGTPAVSASVPGATLAPAPTGISAGVAAVSASAPAASLSPGPITITASLASVSVTAPAADLVSGSAPQTLVGGVASVSAAVPAATVSSGPVGLPAGVATVTATSPAAALAPTSSATMTAGLASVTVTAPTGTLTAGSPPQTLDGGVATVSCVVPLAVLVPGPTALAAGVALVTATVPGVSFTVPALFAPLRFTVNALKKLRTFFLRRQRIITALYRQRTITVILMAKLPAFDDKRVGETANFAFDLVNELAAGETLSSPTWSAAVSPDSLVADGNPGALISGAASISGTKTLQKLTGGVSGCLYVITATLQTSAGQILQPAALLKVI